MLCVFVATLAVNAYEWKCACCSTQYILQARVHVAARIKPHTRTDAYSASALLNTVQHNLQCQHSSLMREENPNNHAAQASLSTPTPPSNTNKTSNLHYTTTKYKTNSTKKHDLIAICTQTPVSNQGLVLVVETKRAANL